MKTIDIFCASQAATTTMDSNTPSSSSSGSGGRAIDRHNPIIQDQKRLTKTPPSPNNKTTKTSKNNTNDQKRTSTSFADENENKHDHQQIVTNNNKKAAKKQGPGGVLLGWGCTKPSGFISPATSSRFLLADKSLSDQFDPLLKKHVLPPQQPLVQLEKTRKSFSDRFFKNKNDHVCQSALPVVNVVDANKRKDEVVMLPVLPVINVASKKKDEGRHDLPSSPALTAPRSSSSLSSRSSEQQEVVLRVSLHCRGCEKKMRKHISKMEGVTSFNIDFLAKKVTVVGDITPLAVLTSVSKVKNAKLLTPTTMSSPHVPPTPSDSNLSEVKKQLGL